MGAFFVPNPLHPLHHTAPRPNSVVPQPFTRTHQRVSLVEKLALPFSSTRSLLSPYPPAPLLSFALDPRTPLFKMMFKMTTATMAPHHAYRPY